MSKKNSQRNQKNAKSQGPKAGNKNNNTQKPKKLVQKRVPVAMATGVTGRSPSIRTTEKSNVVEHRELVDNFTVTTDPFKVVGTYPLNPGSAQTFPWLGTTQALGWEKYYFEYLRFRLLTRASTTSVGSAIMAPDLDAADNQPSSEQVACTYAHSVEDALWKDIVCEIPCDRTKRFVRTGNLAANLDIKTYDMGNLFTACAGCSTAGVYAKLWVEYKVRFFVPQLPPLGINVGGSFSSGGGISVANPLGSAPISNLANVGVSIDNLSNVTFGKVGTYLTNLGLAGTAITSAGAPVISSGVGTVLNSGIINSAQTQGNVKSEINITQAPAILSLANAIAGTSLTSSHFDVATAPQGSL